MWIPHVAHSIDAGAVALMAVALMAVKHIHLCVRIHFTAEMTVSPSTELFSQRALSVHSPAKRKSGLPDAKRKSSSLVSVRRACARHVR